MNRDKKKEINAKNNRTSFLLKKGTNVKMIPSNKNKLGWMKLIIVIFPNL